VGWITSITAVAAIGVRPQVGKVMDTRGRRVVILTGNVLNVMAVAGYLAVDSIGPLVYAVRILHGLAEALLFTSLFTYAADLVPESRRTEGLALFGVSGMLPVSLGGVLGDLVLARADYHVLFQVALGLSLVAALLSWPLRDRPPAGGSADDAGPRQGFRAVLSQAELIPLWWIAGIFTTALTSVFVFLKLFVELTGVGTVGGFFTAYAATAISIRIFLGWLPDRAGPKRVLFPALLALAAGFLVLGLARSDGTVWLAGALCGFGHGYTFPILFSIVVTRARRADRGTAMAIYTGLFDLGVLIGGPSLGSAIERFGFTFMFHGAAGLVLIGSLVFAIWDRGRR
jgi:MFS family permease